MKTLYIIALLFLSFISNAQEKEYMIVEKPPVSTMLICSNETRDKWFMIMPHFKEYNGITVKSFLTTMKLNIGKCSKRDVLTFTFVDGKYMSVRSNVDLTCGGIVDITFPLNPVQVGVLEMKSIKSIRYVNGNDGTSYLHTLKESDKDYFTTMLKQKVLNKN
jgi:hypothetical protein